VTRVRGETQTEGLGDVPDRLRPYVGGPPQRQRETPSPRGADTVPPILEELMVRASTLVAVMPPHQRRAAIEELVCPRNPERGRLAVDALIKGAFFIEDDKGCLRRLRSYEPVT
jgi:hypothetical protein